MRRYLKFAASFWISAFLMTASLAVAQTKSAAKKRKKGGASAANSATSATTFPAHQT